MQARIGIALAICLWWASAAAAQVVVRFETTIGHFDMVLNPTNNPVLQDHVDNMLHYIESNSYRSSWINRADTGFVLQMGGFYSHTKRPPLTIASTRPVATVDPVLGEPAVETGLSNTVGTVSLALPGAIGGGTNQNGGTSSFFVNLTSNTFLDRDFTVFAAIPDMTVVNQIMALPTIDRTMDPVFGAGPGNLAFTDVPLEDNGFQVFIKRAFAITDTMTIARATAGVQSIVEESAARFAESAATFAEASATFAEGSDSQQLSTTVVPEPATALMATLGLLWLVVPRHRRNG